MVIRVIARIWIQVLSVDYGGPRVTMNIPFAQELQDQHSRRYRAIFLNADVVGALYMNDEDIEDDTCLSPFHVLAFNIRTRQETNIRVVLQWPPGEEPYHVCPRVLSTLGICIINCSIVALDGTRRNFVLGQQPVHPFRAKLQWSLSGMDP